MSKKYFLDLHHLCRPPSIYNVLQFQFFFYYTLFHDALLYLIGKWLQQCLKIILLFHYLFPCSQRAKFYFVHYTDWRYILCDSMCAPFDVIHALCCDVILTIVKYFWLGKWGRVHFRVKYLWYFQEFSRLTVTHISVHLILFVCRKLINHCIWLYCLLRVTHLQGKHLLVMLFLFTLPEGHHKTSTLSLCHLKDLFS